MKEIFNEKGYALIIVLALVVIVTILMVPYLNSFLHDAQEIKIETVKNQNNYTLESAVEITRGIIEKNNIMLEDDLEAVVSIIDSTSQELFGEEITGTIEKDNNQITYATKNTYSNKRAESKITLTYKTYDLGLFYDHPVITKNDKSQSGKKINGNNHFMSSFDEQDILTVTDDLFQLLINFKLQMFQEAFSYSGSDAFYNEWDSAPLEEDLYLDNLWIDGPASIEGLANESTNLIIQEDFYIAGDLSLKKLDNLIIYGDLVVYDGSLDIGSVGNIEVRGSLIVNGNVRITGNPSITLGNLSADDIRVNSNNTDIFYLFYSGDNDSHGKDKGREARESLEFIDGKLEIENWRIE